MTTCRVELAPERPGRQQRVIGQHGVKPAYGEDRCFQPHDHVTVGGLITHRLSATARLEKNRRIGDRDEAATST
jgi:hypothetical protein